MPAFVGMTGVLLAACGVVVDSMPGTKATRADPTPPIESVPRAACGPGSQQETGIQGQVPQADRQSGRSQQGYWCNLEKVGQWQHGEGASWQFAWYEDCGYYGTLMGEARTTLEGAVVVDASDPAHPKETALLTTPAVMDPHESLKVAEKRALLGAVDLNGPFFDVYDLAGECTHPMLITSVEFAGTAGHEGNWSQDGLTYWNGDRTSGDNKYCPIDVTDPANPKLIMCWSNPGTTHGMSTNEDGTRGYFSMAQGGNLNADDRPGSPNGLLVADTSDIQARKADPDIRIVGEIFWTDGAQAQMTQPVSIGGKPYVLFTDELDRGAGRLIDISDEANPFIASRLKLEVHLAENSGLDARDGGAPLFVYDGHYCTADDPTNTTAVACGYFESGIRVFDVRDPAAPKEIAYYIPPALNKQLAGSSNSSGGAQTADACAAQIRFVKERGELWTQCQDNEFLVLRFTNGAWPFAD